MKVKIFSIKGKFWQSLSNMSLELEHEINNWIESNSEINIIKIKQSSCGGSLEQEKLFVSVWYEN